MPARRLRKLPVVALVGRTNVGKSTLWNRLTETMGALVSEEEHTTRDRNYGDVLWRGETFEVIDTGGMDVPEGPIENGIRAQAHRAIKDADLVLFLVDTRSGILPQDRELARESLKLNKHILLVSNKADDLKSVGAAFAREVWGLTLGEPIYCSASTGRGVGDLLDRVFVELARLGKPPAPAEKPGGLRVVVMGRPNVGKSSLVNGILGEERVIVSPIAHTTREPIDTALEWKGEPVTLVDTAGMRRRSLAEPGLEEESLERNRLALKRADIALLVFDATESPKKEDKRLAGLMKDETKGLVLVANKWDLVPDKTEKSTKEFEQRLRRDFPFLAWAPIIFISAKDRQRVHKVLDLAFNIREERRRQITYNALQKFLKVVLARKKPLAEVGAFSPYVHDVTQIGIDPPRFQITVRGRKGNLHESWLRYFENRLREKFGFQGTPIVIKAQTVAISDKDMMNVTKKGQKPRRKRPIGRKGFRY